MDDAQAKATRAAMAQAVSDQQQPGPELNAAVARAIGWPYREWKDKRGRECCAWEPTTGGTIAPGLWRPSTDIADAMRAADAMREAGWTVEFCIEEPYAWVVLSDFDSERPHRAEAEVLYADTQGDRLAALCLAICRAVVEAGQSKEDER